MAALLSTKTLDCKDLHGYLKTLSSYTLDRLYNHPATCLAVFRELPQLAKHYIMRLLLIDQPVSQAVIGLWSNNKYINDHRRAVQALTDLRIWYEQPLPGGMQGRMVNATFKANMKTALLGGGKPWTGRGGGVLPPDKNSRDVEFLDKYALERWECVLHFMVGSTEGADGVSRDTIEVLKHSGLMKVEEGDPVPYITPAGFQFLLMDTGSQVWYFILQYLDMTDSRGLDLVECLSLMFQLSFSTLGKDYSTEGMSDGQSRFLQHLREFGLVYQRKRKEKRYYPTRLAINLASGLSGIVTDSHRQGYIVVETNYRLYAYTESSLNIALLALFSEMLYRFPNMAVANLTRDSVRAALIRGITAEQIISFLKSHAHSEMVKQTPSLPPTIVDQVRLWELERDRFKFDDGVLYSQFLSQADFEKLRDFAKEQGVLVWDNTNKRVMVVSRAGHDSVKRFWKQQKNS
ncbi:general transcription factor IIH subunit 4-like isoform X3 [Dreissena polymorpha]|uniref:general transcription factor IIH subunit 4-like isoform X1 n=1 Tax=Dreissena polymorpha TaxID=45954 RepID=UPI0022642EEE|nr:general transcription factor IIH subunit 4-like isoform X1 [Dreissena polymorpha]XP_052221727.1 general transcription factor IIH subunit 4-like isoform X2 [Dreissena polymorpha]XP_052221728.1 general transcription factor IIH subunit 4-like isoform X3 [Dreissena polymorpha]